MSQKVKFSKDDEALLNSFSPVVSTKGTIIFLVNALVTSGAPIYLFVGINQLEVSETWIGLLIAVLLSTYALHFASKNFKHVLKHQIIVKRTAAITKEINQKFADDKKMSKKEKEDRVSFRRAEVADEESTYLSVFITNTLFIFTLLFLAFFLLVSLTPLFAAVIAMAGAAGLVAFLSTSKN